MAIVRKHIYFSGQVQGVGFRYRAKNAARANDLTGWVDKDRKSTRLNSSHSV